MAAPSPPHIAMQIIITLWNTLYRPNTYPIFFLSISLLLSGLIMVIAKAWKNMITTTIVRVL